MEALAVEAFPVRDVIECIGDEIDRHDVDPAALDADHRHPLREQLAHPLQCLEEIVGTVDLVDLTRAGVADDETRPIDPERPRAFAANDALRVVLGPEVRIVEVLGLLEHVLPEDAVVEPRGSDRAHVVEAAGADGARELHRVPRALDVGDLLRFGAGLQVVDRSQMEHVVDLALEPAHVGCGHAELGLREVADDRDHLLLVHAPGLAQLGQARERALAHQHVHRRLAPDQVGDQVTADESCCAGHEIGHRCLQFGAGAAAGATRRFALPERAAGRRDGAVMRVADCTRAIVAASHGRRVRLECMLYIRCLESIRCVTTRATSIGEIPC